MGEAVSHGGAVRTIGGQIVVWLFGICVDMKVHVFISHHNHAKIKFIQLQS